MSKRTLLAPGELRAELMQIFADPELMDILAAAPGLLDRTFEGYTALAREPDRSLGVRTAGAFRQALLEALADALDRLVQAPENATRIRAWRRALANEGVRVRHHHRAPLFTRLLSYSTETLVLNGPLTGSRFESNDELELVLSGAEHERARAWFTRHWDQADDITDGVRDVFDACWAGEALDARSVYFSVLVRYFRDTLEEFDLDSDDNPLLARLTDFQEDAYRHAKGILRRYGGVFLADVVGLGKTFIALALIHHLRARHGERALVIAPPAVCEAWERLRSELDLSFDTLSIGKLDTLDDYDCGVLVIDESHNFRNTGTQRADLLHRWLRPGGGVSSKRVILLSATPQNNSPRDVLNQLRLFPDTHARLPYAAESLSAFFEAVRHEDAELTDLLQHVVVRRTRRFIQQAYPGGTLRRRVGPGRYETIPIRFPKRISGPEQCLRYSLEATYGETLYARIIAALAAMRYPTHALGTYILEAHVDEPSLSGIRRAGTSVRGLYKVVLLKRLESSVYAFQRTIQRLEARLEDAFTRLEDQVVRVRRTVSDADGPADQAGVERIVEVDLSAHLFDVRQLEADLWHDLEHVNRLGQAVAAIGARDAKCDVLEAALTRRAPSAHRTLIFTQFADTAEHLGRVLAQRFGRTAVAQGGGGNTRRLARRFAPVAQHAQVDPDDEIDLLISTDALSEGVNLQDADTLINYDLHWNPVRLIQRAGRIDRLGSGHDTIHIASFLPERGLERQLGLETVLRARIDDFLAVFGGDSGVLPAEEKLDLEQLTSAYDGTAFDDADADAEMDGLSRHRGRLMHLRRADPEEYARVLTLRPGRRAFTGGALEPVVAHRLGWRWSFWTQRAGEATEIVNQAGLDLMWRHANAPVEPEDMARDAALSALVVRTRTQFEPIAKLYRQQKRYPRLTAIDVFLRDSLLAYRERCVASRHPRVDQLVDWVQGGAAKAPLQRVGRLWKREKLPPAVVFEELSPLFRRLSRPQEALGQIEVVAAVAGSLKRVEKTGQ